MSTEQRYGRRRSSEAMAVYSWCGLQPTLIAIPAPICASPESHPERVVALLARHGGQRACQQIDAGAGAARRPSRVNKGSGRSVTMAFSVCATTSMARNLCSHLLILLLLRVCRCELLLPHAPSSLPRLALERARGCCSCLRRRIGKEATTPDNSAQSSTMRRRCQVPLLSAHVLVDYFCNVPTSTTDGPVSSSRSRCCPFSLVS